MELPSDVDLEEVELELPPDDEDGLSAGHLAPTSLSGAKERKPRQSVLLKKPARSTSSSSGVLKRPSKASTKGSMLARKMQRGAPAGVSLKELTSCIPGEPSCPFDQMSMQRVGLERSRDDFWEVFSPPRVSPYCRDRGLSAPRSVDLETGWDLLNPDHQTSLMGDIKHHQPMFIFLSPPCTMFSQLMFCNWDRMKVETREARLHKAVMLLDVAMWIAEEQMLGGRYFALEHPAFASSWSRPNVQNSEQCTGQGGRVGQGL